MTTLKTLYCRVRKAVKFTVGVFGLIAMFCAAWVQLGFPVPATAADVKELSKGQAQIGIQVQLQAEKAIRRDLFDLRWKLREIQASNAHNGNPRDQEFEKYLEQQIIELEALEQHEHDLRNEYKEQLQRATK